MATLVVTGRLGADAELRTLQNDNKVVAWSMAYETGFGDKKKSHWVKCALFGKRAATLAPMLTKGTLVEVTGEPVVSTWKDKKSGEPRGQIEVTVFEVKLHGGGKSKNDNAGKPDDDWGQPRDQGDDIPF